MSYIKGKESNGVKKKSGENIMEEKQYYTILNLDIFVLGKSSFTSYSKKLQVCITY